jgi:uncharacterized membrane protein
MKMALQIFRTFFIYLLLSAGTFLMLQTILKYTTFEDDVEFLEFKQDYLHITTWKVAFYVHVFSSIFTLLAGLTQFSDYILKNYKKLHRFIGRLYAYDILLINFPAGMIMAVYANGYLPSKIAFVILDCLWFYFTWRAVQEARRKNIMAHKQFMIRSYALTLSALTLRSWKIVFTYTTPLDPMTIYMIDAWMGFVPNLLVAEWLIRSKLKKRTRALPV